MTVDVSGYDVIDFCVGDGLVLVWYFKSRF